MKMADISVNQAMGAGFRLIARRPRTVFIWGLILTPLAVGLTMWLQLAFMLAFAHTTPDSDPDPSPVGGQVRLMAMVLFPIALITSAVLKNAVLRALDASRPPDRFAFIRVGWGELWAGLMRFVFGAILLALFALALVGVALLADRIEAGQRIGGVMAVVLAGAVTTLVGGWLWSRTRLSPWVAGLRGRPVLAEGWAAGRGQVFRLAIMSLVTSLLISALSALCLIGLGFPALGVFLSLSQDGVAALAIPLLLCASLGPLLLGPAWVLATAPFADAALQRVAPSAAPPDAPSAQRSPTT